MGISSTFQGQEYLFYRQRNLLYNGAMQVAQRGTSTASITSSGYYTADRWRMGIASSGTWTASVENDAPTGSGFRKSLKMLCTTAAASPASGAQFRVHQNLEGQDIQLVRKGTSSAEHLTVSFWVKSNVTGTYIVELYDDDNTRQCSKSYTINASGTWEQKIITFPPDTTGAFDNDNNGSLRCDFWLVTGSDTGSGTLNTSWAAVTAANRAAGQTNVAAATNNYWQITGTQLNIGPVATPFEFKSFGQELAECQRYYCRFSASGMANNHALLPVGVAGSTTAVNIVGNYPVEMRVAPPISGGLSYGGTLQLTDGTNYPTTGALSLPTSGRHHYNVQVVATAATQYRPYWLYSNGDISAYVAFSAEL